MATFKQTILRSRTYKKQNLSRTPALKKIHRLRVLLQK